MSLVCLNLNNTSPCMCIQLHSAKTLSSIRVLPTGHWCCQIRAVTNCDYFRYLPRSSGPGRIAWICTIPCEVLLPGTYFLKVIFKILVPIRSFWYPYHKMSQNDQINAKKYTFKTLIFEFSRNLSKSVSKICPQKECVFHLSSEGECNISQKTW